MPRQNQNCKHLQPNCQTLTQERRINLNKKRILAISDIHGCADLFAAVLIQANYEPQTDQLILLGDYIDRGEKSYETVQMVKSLVNEGAIALCGNHEDMAIQAFEDDFGNAMELWYQNGVRDTMRSYRRNQVAVRQDLDFFKSLTLYQETEDYIFVHAGINPYIPILGDNDRDTLLWSRNTWLRSAYDGKPVVFGHTPTETVMFDTLDNKIRIDTGAAYWGKLSCLELPDRKVHSVQDKQKTNAHSFR